MVGAAPVLDDLCAPDRVMAEIGGDSAAGHLAAADALVRTGSADRRSR